MKSKEAEAKVFCAKPIVCWVLYQFPDGSIREDYLCAPEPSWDEDKIRKYAESFKNGKIFIDFAFSDHEGNF